MQVSELLSMEKCDQAVIDYLAATDCREVPAQASGGARAGGFSVWDFISLLLYLIDRFRRFMLSFVRRGRRVAGVELRHLAG